MLVRLAADPPDWTAPRFEGPALSRVAEADGTAPDILAPAIADLPKPPVLSNRTLAWAALSLVLHGAALVWLTRSDLPPITDAMEGTPVEVISAADLAPLAVEADALVSTPEIQVAEAPRVPVPEEATAPEAPPPPEPATAVLDEPSAQPVAEATPQPLPEPAPQPVELAELPTPVAPPEPAPPVAEIPPQPPAKPAPKAVPVKSPPARPAATSTHEPQRPRVAAPAAPAAPAGADLAAWHGSIFSRLRAAMRYPDGARARGAMGQASVAFSLDAGGRVTSASVVHSSGHADLDAEAGAIVRRASPFPPPPPGAPRSMTVPINFRLR